MEYKDLIKEIKPAEEIRAKKAIHDIITSRWVKELRETYIADGFLMPFYFQDGHYFRSKSRISQFGYCVLPDDRAGEVFYRGTIKTWIHMETTWFWDYLIHGQEYIFTQPVDSLPENLRVTGTPAELVWKMLTTNIKQMGLFGEDGGGVMISADDLKEELLVRLVPKQVDFERENGYVEPYKIDDEPRWITLFHQYEAPEYARAEIELRPAWFHLTNYAFFNIPVTRLPVFLGVFENGQIDRIRFLDDSLSDRARDFIGKELLDLPIELKKQSDTRTLKRERDDMTWWLWHHAGHRRSGRTLSYGQISVITNIPRSSVQVAVERFNRQLRDKLDNKLLKRLLETSYNLGLEYNLTYRALVKRGLAPPREREIDGFDELDKLL